MFNWNVEEMKLLTMDRVGKAYELSILRGPERAFVCESEVSIEDKFDFIDRMQNGKLSYIVGLIEGYQEAESSLKGVNIGILTDNLKREWVHNNDRLGLIYRNNDTKGRFGDFIILGWEGNLFDYLGSLNVSINGRDVHLRIQTGEEGFINFLFHEQLCECKGMEYEYFIGQDKTAQFFTTFRKKYCDHDMDMINHFNGFMLEVTCARNPLEKGKVVAAIFGVPGLMRSRKKELPFEAVQQIDAELSILDELKAKGEQAEKAYEEARLSLSKKIKAMAE